MATRYRFGNNENPHFVTFAVINCKVYQFWQQDNHPHAGVSLLLVPLLLKDKSQ